MMMKYLTISALLTLAACTDGPNAARVLEDAGYKDVRIGGYAAFSCDGKSDTFATSFTATAPSGRNVSGAVCKGVLKGSTIRLD